MHMSAKSVLLTAGIALAVVVAHEKVKANGLPGGVRLAAG
jgi:hypothetical protein